MINNNQKGGNAMENSWTQLIFSTRFAASCIYYGLLKIHKESKTQC